MGPAGVSAPFPRRFCRQLGGLDSRRKGAESQTSPPEFASGAPGDRRGRPCGNIRTGRVRPAKPPAEGKPHRPQFLENQAPVGREKPLTATQILRAGNAQIIFRYASPIAGSGESGPMDLGGAERSRSPSAASPAILWFLSHRWERNSPPGRRNSPSRSGSAGRLDVAQRRGAYAPKGKRSRPLTPDPAVPGPPAPASTVPHFCSAFLPEACLSRFRGPGFFESSGGVNPPSGKVRLRRTLGRRTAAGRLRAQRQAESSAHSRSSCPRASSARFDSSAFLFRLPLTR